MNHVSDLKMKPNKVEGLDDLYKKLTERNNLCVHIKKLLRLQDIKDETQIMKLMICVLVERVESQKKTIYSYHLKQNGHI